MFPCILPEQREEAVLPLGSCRVAPTMLAEIENGLLNGNADHLDLLQVARSDA
jgi:hypothetical protein